MVLGDLEKRLAVRERRSLVRRAHAAVLVPVIHDDAGPMRLLLTRRTHDLPTHAGHVAFPGGHLGPGDEGVVSAALREAQEEVALPPASVEVLGLLDDFPTLADDVAVTPVVGRITRLPPLVADPREVAHIFTIPLSALRDPTGWRTQQYERDGMSWPVYFFDWEGETLWGLSAYITLHLLDLLGGAPFGLPAARLR